MGGVKIKIEMFVALLLIQLSSDRPSLVSTTVTRRHRKESCSTMRHARGGEAPPVTSCQKGPAALRLWCAFENKQVESAQGSNGLE